MREGPEFFRRTIILIDDDPDDLVLVRRTLLRGGVRDPILTFQRSIEAVEYLRASGAPEHSRLVLFCDLKMPGLDGFAVLQWVRAQEFSDRVTVVMVSGCALESDVERARALGADGYLEKMPSPETLRACLDSPVFAATGPRPALFARWEATHPATLVH